MSSANRLFAAKLSTLMPKIRVSVPSNAVLSA